MKKNIYFIYFLIVLAVCFVMMPVMAYNCTCNCTERNVTYSSAYTPTAFATRYSPIPIYTTPYIYWPTVAQAIPPSNPDWTQISAHNSGASWVWPWNTVSSTYYDGPFIFKRNFTFNRTCCWDNIKARINISADDTFYLKFNNNFIGFGSSSQTGACQWSPPQEYSYDISPYLQSGYNEINITAQNYGLPCHRTPVNAGVIYRLKISYVDCCENYTAYSYGYGCNSNSLQQDLSDSTAATSPVSTPPPLWPLSVFFGK
jgi:hypothetical protein